MVKRLLKGAWTVPNLISLIRIALIPVFAVLYYQGHTLWALFVLFLSGLSDTLDGRIARRFNQVSELGKVLDPFADKLTQVTIAIMLFLEFRKSGSPAMQTFSWVFLFFLGKEALMVVVALVMLILGAKPIAAEIYGKVSTLAFYTVMIVIIAFGPEVGAISQVYPAWTLPESVTMILVIICAVLTFVALLSYIPPSIRELRRIKDEKQKVGES